MDSKQWHLVRYRIAFWTACGRIPVKFNTLEKILFIISNNIPSDSTKAAHVYNFLLSHPAGASIVHQFLDLKTFCEFDKYSVSLYTRTR